MGTDHETEAKSLASAKSEFLEKGYAKASLRKICANAGMTTGALYFFFKDKEDLFRSIVEKPFRELLEMMKIHFAEDAQFFPSQQVMFMLPEITRNWFSFSFTTFIKIGRHFCCS